MQALERTSSPAIYAPPPVEAPEKMRKLAADFEASFLAEMLRPMFEAQNTEGLGGGGEGERMFRPMLVEQYAKGIAQNGGIGLADMVVREMVKMQEMANGADRR